MALEAQSWAGGLKGEGCSVTFWGSFYEYLLPSVPLCQWAQGSHPPSEGRSWSGTGMANLPQQESCLLGKD